MLQNVPIRRKVMTVNFLISAAVLLLACAGFAGYEVVALHKSMMLSYTTRAQIIAANSSAALAFQDESDATRILGALKTDPRIMAACIYDNTGKIFTRFPTNAPAQNFPAAPGKSGYRDGSLQIFCPVVQGSRTLGTVYLQSDLSALTDLYHVYAWLCAAIVVSAALLGYLLSRGLQKQISVPVLALAETVKTVSRRQDFSIRAKKIGNDEIGSLTDAFNQMLARIEEQNKSLRESESKLRTIIENLTEGLAVSDLNGQLTHFNRVALEQHGFSSLEECRLHLNEFTNLIELSTMSGTVLPVEQWPLARILRGEPVSDLELRVRHFKRGWRKVFNYGGTLIHDADGKPTMAVVIISDITERVRVAEEIRKLNAELEQRVIERTAQLEAANKELEAFSYSVSHDLRAPLRAVDGFSQAVQEDYGTQLPDEGRRYLQTIRDGAQRMGTLIDDLLMFSRLSRAPLSRRLVSVEKLVGEVIEEVKPRQPGREIKIHVSKLPPCRGDAALLKQVWVNLVSNAFKYSRNRDPAVIEIGCSCGISENVYFVRDNGAGFDMKYAHKLFGVFQRLHRAEEYEGTGVGLAIVQRVVHRHGGRVWAEAVPDQGAAFFFSLPTGEGGNGETKL
ncbi:MAG TPA: ATP-binding protein [Verrucomicrobiae bacterium]|nr:ATP-binding protein [Verrucomicrobiae bacterium]